MAESKINKPTKRTRGGDKQRREDLSSYLFGKVPPQAVTLEEAVLGAVMLDKDALTEILDVLVSDSFYVDAHKSIYGAMLRLFERSQPIDLLTVVEELKKEGELESAGGPVYLAELTNKVASAANIEYHARIIAQKFIQRELIRISTKTINDAFEDTTDVFELLDEAEQGLFNIAEKNMGRAVDRMGTLASRLIKQLEALKDMEEGLTGVPTGFTELDRLTSGLQRSDLIILAARPGMGKTALTLSLAKNAAVDFSKPVAVFSLEMSSLQLAMRIISMEAEIPGSKLRNGQLEEYEWQQLHSAIEKVADAPIFIDDTPGINTFELRAKCRRLKMQHDIQLIIIDYLQLMSGGGDNKQGNREQEVSGISRALKGLAKELDVPVIALSQLSRAVETRGGDKRPQLSDLRESGCLTGDAILQDARTGRRMTIKDLAEREQQVPLSVQAMDTACRVAGHTMVKAFYSGRKEVFELTTRSGRKIKASANHPFRVLGEWKRLDELKVGEQIATPRQLSISHPENPLGKDELILLAHLIGDGCIIPKQPYHYTSADPQNIQIVEEKAERLFSIKGRIVPQGTWAHIYLPSPQRLARGRRHPITNWYADLGLERKRSYAKSVPEAVFRCDDERVALFLHHLWATDGNISWKKLTGRKPSAAIYYASSSEVLATQVQHLLLRLGILSTVSEVGQGKYRSNFHVHVQGKPMQMKFLKRVGCYGERGKIIPELTKALEQIVSNTNQDVIPGTVWQEYIKPAMKAKGISQRQLSALLGIAHAGSYFSGNVSRARLHKLGVTLDEPKLLDLAQSDLYWDEIVAINSLGEQDVYDATVPGVHNFVANNIVVHNSIEQDADMVAFIYRPEYYQIMEDEEGQSLKGIGEVIIAKNRHGALKTVRLRFTGEYARFSNLDDPDFANLPGDTFESPFNNIITKPSKMNDDEDIPF